MDVEAGQVIGPRAALAVEPAREGVVEVGQVEDVAEVEEERVVALSRRVADWVERWHGRLLFHADLHGIVTGPQILDRVASALIKATQRP